MTFTTKLLATCMSATVLLLASSATAYADDAEVDFGTDDGMWANDDECDDPRFEGPGMTTTTLLEADILNDATDCRTAFEAGNLTYIGLPAEGAVNFGTNDSIWADNGECDDPRFEGEGVADTLLDDDAFKDSADCEAAYNDGTITITESGQIWQAPAAIVYVDMPGGFSFGDDTSDWANNGECDDPRFGGDGAASTLLEGDAFRDATDCEAAYDAGTIQVTEEGATWEAPALPVFVDLPDDFVFGDDTSEWANDGECDDPRFAGDGAADILLEDDAFHDATDCEAAYITGDIQLTEEGAAMKPPVVLPLPDDFDFGDDTSPWSNDGECDDPRFIGKNSAAKNIPEDSGHDSTDCMRGYQRGDLGLIGGARDMPIDATVPASEIDFGDNSSEWTEDGECDDPRFLGNNMATKLSREDEGHDADDCQALYEAGNIRLK